MNLTPKLPGSTRPTILIILCESYLDCYRKKTLSLGVYFGTVMAALQTLTTKCAGSIKHNTKDLSSKRENNNQGAGAGARKYIPCPFLQCPHNAYEDRMEVSSPEQERGRPGEISEELIMEGPCTQQADCERCQHHCHDKRFRERRRALASVDRVQEEVEQVGSRWLQPICGKKESQEGDVQR